MGHLDGKRDQQERPGDQRRGGASSTGEEKPRAGARGSVAKIEANELSFKGMHAKGSQQDEKSANPRSRARALANSSQ